MGGVGGYRDQTGIPVAWPGTPPSVLTSACGQARRPCRRHGKRRLIDDDGWMPGPLCVV